MEITHAIARCKAGDKAAYAEVVAAYASRLVGVLQKLVGNIEDARDIAQETFVRAYLNLDRYDPGRPFAPWLYRIGRNLAYNHLKASGRRLDRSGSGGDDRPLDAFESDIEAPDGRILEDEKRGNIDALLKTMRPEYREVLTLRYLVKLEYDEIAARMSIPKGTVKTWLNRAKVKFRTLAEGSDYF